MYIKTSTQTYCNAKMKTKTRIINSLYPVCDECNEFRNVICNEFNCTHLFRKNVAA